MESVNFQQVFKNKKKGGDDDEDWIQYLVFPQGGLDDVDTLLLAMNATAHALTQDYLWHNEPFALKTGGSRALSSFEEDEDEDEEEEGAKAAAVGEDPPYFYGMTRYGENVEDEWFIVQVLMDLSDKFPEVVIKVDDNDGEFILIEAAEHLPAWAESDEVCKNRVYIYQGRVHIIPPTSSNNSPLKIAQAVESIRMNPSLTLASDEVQKCITNRRLSEVKMSQMYHHSNLMLPPLLATILKLSPTLVSAGCRAFFMRDPISLKAIRLLKTFKPNNGLVKSRVRFTRCLYAMLVKQDYRPDVRSGWAFPTNTGIAPSSQDSSSSSSSANYKMHSLGAKLTAGFEILLNEYSSLASGQKNVNNAAHDAFDDNSSQWFHFKNALDKAGYFKGFLEGSKPYDELLISAKQFFSSNCVESKDGSTSHSSASDANATSWDETVARNLQQLVENTTDVDLLSLEEESRTLPADDDDSWMSINPEDLDLLLEAKFQSGGLNPSNIPSILKEFMTQLSDFSGVETNSDLQANKENSNGNDKPDNDFDEEDMFEDEEAIGEGIDFKADEFVSAIDKLLHDLGAPEYASSSDSLGSEEEETNDDLESIRKMHTFSKETKEFFGIMDDMDKELAKTNVGQTFRQPAKDSKKAAPTATADDDDEEEEGLTPVDIDMNALTNMLQSFHSQEGPIGPSANLLRSIGVGSDQCGGGGSSGPSSSSTKSTSTNSKKKKAKK